MGCALLRQLRKVPVFFSLWITSFSKTRNYFFTLTIVYSLLRFIHDIRAMFSACLMRKQKSYPLGISPKIDTPKCWLIFAPYDIAVPMTTCSIRESLDLIPGYFFRPNRSKNEIGMLFNRESTSRLAHLVGLQEIIGSTTSRTNTPQGLRRKGCS